MRMMRWVALLSVVLALVPRGVCAAPVTPEERWYTVSMQGQRVGWMREAVTALRTGNIRTEMEMSMKVGRFDDGIEIVIRTGFVETPEGKPVEMRMMQKMGMVEVQSRSLFEEDRLVTQTRQFGMTSERVEPLPQEAWLTPMQAAEFVRKRLEAGATEIVFTTIDPTLGATPVGAKMRIGERVTVHALGRDIEGFRAEVEQSVVPDAVQRTVIDRDGSTLVASVVMGQFEIDMHLATRAEAMAEVEPLELMVDTLVRPKGVPIARGHRTMRGSYLVRAKQGRMPDLPSIGVQRAERLDESTIRVVLDLNDRAPAPDKDVENAAYRSGGPMVNIDDPEVVRLAMKAVEGIDARDARGRARAIERFVIGHMRQTNLNVAFATASEVARTGEGDCSEYSVLTVALCRAVGIPARGVTGLVYIDDFGGNERVFGYHMWAQALVPREDGEGMEWIDLDGAMRGMSGTHIAESVSAMSGDLLQEMVSAAMLIGNIEIVVEWAE